MKPGSSNVGMKPSSSKSCVPLTLKLLVDKTANKVLFAEASKEFVDFLFTLLALPVATVVHLMAAPNMVGSVGNIYTSLSMNAPYLQPILNKEALLNPKISTNSTATGLLRLTMETLPDTMAPTGYVKSAMAYMVMDDLSFSPMSTISGITLLNRFSVTDLRSLEERFVVVGMDE